MNITCDNTKRIYIICAVRGESEETIAPLREYAEALRVEGHWVHFPPDDVDQNDLTGESICRDHRDAMEYCEQVHVFWDMNSKGSHFDLGMAYALRKTIVGVKLIHPDNEGKSYWKAVIDG